MMTTNFKIMLIVRRTASRYFSLLSSFCLKVWCKDPLIPLKLPVKINNILPLWRVPGMNFPPVKVNFLGLAIGPLHWNIHQYVLTHWRAMCNGPARSMGYILVGKQHGPVWDCIRASTKMWTLWCAIWVLLLSVSLQNGLGLSPSNSKYYSL